MGDSLDYIYPGSVLLCFGLVSTLNTFYLAVIGKTSEAASCQSLTAQILGTPFPIEGAAKVVLCFIGVLIELLTSTESNMFLSSQDHQEMAIYLIYLFAALTECFSSVSQKADKRITILAYAVASFIEAFMVSHFVVSEYGGCLVKCWALAAALQGLALLVQACGLTALAVVALRNITLLAHGTWFWHIGLSDYIYAFDPKSDAENEGSTVGIIEEEVQITTVASAFGVHVFFALMFVSLSHLIMSSIIERPENAMDGNRHEVEALISDEESEEEQAANKDAKTKANSNDDNSAEEEMFKID